MAALGILSCSGSLGGTKDPRCKGLRQHHSHTSLPIASAALVPADLARACLVKQPEFTCRTLPHFSTNFSYITPWSLPYLLFSVAIGYFKTFAMISGLIGAEKSKKWKVRGQGLAVGAHGNKTHATPLKCACTSCLFHRLPV